MTSALSGVFKFETFELILYTQSLITNMNRYATTEANVQFNFCIDCVVVFDLQKFNDKNNIDGNREIERFTPSVQSK